MALIRLWTLGALALVAADAPARAAGPSAVPGKPTTTPAYARDADALAARVDRLLAASWKKNGVLPAPAAHDAEFLRRVYLDLAGRLPPVAEARRFLDDPSPDKRLRLVERLLDGPNYVNHFTNVWRSLLLPEANTSFQTRFLAPGFETWVRKQLVANAPYDVMVRELLTAPVGNGQPGPFPNGTTPLGYYLAKELKPENLAASSARLFLGIKIECAQCHNHPFAVWKRDQFWGYAAFFSGIRGQNQGDFVAPGNEVPDRRELTIPGTEKVVQASFPDGSKPAWKGKRSTRATLADWMTRADNPYFARAAANRLWAHFFGSGLIDPVDEIAGADHQAAQPEVLDELARALAEHRFDLKFLMRAIAATRAYQLTSAATDRTQDEPGQFARMAVKGLSAEQLYDSLAEATGFRDGAPQPGPFFQGNNGARAAFVARFGNTNDKPTEVQTSILQALSLMNGRVVADATSLERSETLAAVVDAPFLDTAGRVEALYLATLARKPTPRELSRLLHFIETAQAAPASGSASGAGDERYKLALADVLWALLNSSEFFLNH